MSTTLYYIHDPMCSWCWGYRPVWDELQKNLPMGINVEYVVGGLAPDSDEPMRMEQQEIIQAHWRIIEEKLGTQFNGDFWIRNVARRSTYNACRAVIAAKKQKLEQEMLDAIQRGYYLRALNPSDKSILIQLAEELASKKLAMNVTDFAKDLNSVEVETELMRQIDFARKLTQHGFPSLVLKKNGECHRIMHDYKDHILTFKQINTIHSKKVLS